MSRALGYMALAAFAAGSVALVAARPDWASDQNSFLKNFVTHEFLSLLGVILAITLASVANIHFEFNRIEERYQKRALVRSRQNLAKNTFWLIGLFCVAVALVSLKPIVSGGEVAEATFNLAAVMIVLWHVLILISLTQLAFAIDPDISEAEFQKPQLPPDTAKEKQP